MDWRYDKGFGCWTACLAALAVVVVGFLLRIGWEMGGEVLKGL